MEPQLRVVLSHHPTTTEQKKQLSERFCQDPVKKWINCHHKLKSVHLVFSKISIL